MILTIHMSLWIVRICYLILYSLDRAGVLCLEHTDGVIQELVIRRGDAIFLAKADDRTGKDIDLRFAPGQNILQRRGLVARRNRLS